MKANLVEIYKLGYNALQLVGWLSVLLLACSGISSASSIFVDGGSAVTFASGAVLFWIQWTAVLEVLNAVWKIVPAPFFTTALQVLSRVTLVSVLRLIPETRASFGVVLLTFAWSITEVLRSSYYISSLLENTPAALLWLRYSLFVVLYPTGVTGELLVLYSAFHALKHGGHLFGIGWVIPLAGMALYPPGFYKLFMHMISQRSKKLSLQPKTHGH
ncbi:3-hydroxyacyl-CoA dehydratase [Pelomyxa schiedti]|nr:3-hydroxyacyl-CoA dehydratase [Pelomyxa schiedti]